MNAREIVTTHISTGEKCQEKFHLGKTRFEDKSTCYTDCCFVFGTGITTEKSDMGSHLAEVRRRSWRRVPGAASPGVGGGGCCVPSLVSRRLPASLLPHACSPRVSAALRYAPHTPCWFYAVAASRLHVLLRITQTHRETKTKKRWIGEEVRGDAVGPIINFLFAQRCVLLRFRTSLCSGDCGTILG